MLEEESAIIDVMKEAIARHYKGFEKYGQWYPDKKDWLKEAEDELLDLINYCCYQIIKMRKMRGCLNAESNNN